MGHVLSVQVEIYWCLANQAKVTTRLACVELAAHTELKLPFGDISLAIHSFLQNIKLFEDRKISITSQDGM